MSVALKQVTKRFGSFTAVDTLDLEVADGEFLSIVGPSGCGKTTTLRLIAGFLTPDGGEVYISGNRVNGIPPRLRDVGIVFQDYALFPNMTVFDNVAFGLRARRVPEDQVRTRVRELLELVGLQGRATALPRQLSGGQKQRTALARALAITPKVLLLDEPLSALDAKVRLNLRYEIRRIQREAGITTIYVTHDQEEALSISDRVAVMDAGRIRQLDTPEAIYSRPADRMVADFIGISSMLQVTQVSPTAVRWHDHILQVAGAAAGSEATSAPSHQGPAAAGAAQSSAQLVIRPERLRLLRPGDPAGPESYNELRGVIRGRVFLGPVIRYAVEVEGEQLLVDAPHDAGGEFSLDSEVLVRFAPDAARVVHV